MRTTWCYDLKDILLEKELKFKVEFDNERSGTGTYEWAETNFNIQLGCRNRCKYCYATSNALRFNKISSREEWETETIDMKAVNRKWTKQEGVIMFPTTHDITPDNVDYAITALKNMLSAGNNVLIVSKPDPDCIEKMCGELAEYKEQIMFRFTIGSIDADVVKFWEPGAPSPETRISALKYAYETGFKTSVSMEPMLLGRDEAVITFRAVKPYVTDTVWIGKMNKMRNRVDMSVPANVSMVEAIEKLQKDEEILKLVDTLKGETKVRWKDSIKQVIEKNM